MTHPRSISNTPLGVLLIAALFAMIGIGSTGGGVYLMLRGESLNLWAGLTAFLIGPVVLYLAYHLARLAPWTWLVLMVLLGLLFLSSLLRIAAAPSLPISPMSEIAAELAAVFYLIRPPIRAAFQGGKLRPLGIRR